jgi:predicted house-cleaning noncanonical NTP pyrophosphatase (MazG superfamily)
MKIVETGSDDGILDTPNEAFQAIDRDSKASGGASAEPWATDGSIGRTMFDTPSSEDGTVTVLLPKQNIDVLSSQALVRIESRLDSRTYLGAVAEGPFAEPDGLRADSTPMVVTTVKGGFLMPSYHGRAQVEVMGERLGDGTIVPPRRRPRPNSPVFALDAKDTSEVLNLNGNMRLGMADGFDDLTVRVPADSKSLLPRHLGILGTTGGGKSTTVSGLVAKAQREGMSIILIDTEGEYCAINEATQDSRMLHTLKNRGMTAGGVSDTHVMHLVGRDPKNPKHPSISEFSLRFSNLSPYAIQEILELNDAQETRFHKAYDITKTAIERFKVVSRTPDQQSALLELNEFETGYPGMTLNHLYDVVAQIAAIIDKKADDPYLQTPEFRNNQEQLKQLIHASNPESSVPSWRKVQGRLGMLKRLKIFDSTTAKPIDYASLLQSGRVTILDLSDTDSTQINNLVIAELLHGIQEAQDMAYSVAAKEGRQQKPTLIIIEEAHEFLSDQKIEKMPVLFQQVARIARRGRKRWLGLVFVTQLPQHLPDEVLGLINNWALHKISDTTVISRLKKSIGGISEGLWNRLPSLAQGQAIVSFTSMTRPLQVVIDPTPCRLLMTE